MTKKHCWVALAGFVAVGLAPATPLQAVLTITQAEQISAETGRPILAVVGSET